jgi:hypothetical protein
VGPTSGDPAPAGNSPWRVASRDLPPAVAPEQLERLRRILPERIADPVSIADALYLGGHWDEAFLFYERALAATAGTRHQEPGKSREATRHGESREATRHGGFRVPSSEFRVPPSGDGKAWLLFQAANCRRRADPAAAAALYQRLAAEHPQSPWTAVAHARLRILEWRQAERPETLTE